MIEPQSTPRRQPSPMLEKLNSTFPVFRACQPLAIGIHKAIKALMPDVGEGALRAALKAHTSSTKYLKAVANGNQRFDLEGNPAGDITVEQRQQAQETIKERFRKSAERKRAEQQQQERQEKLQKLAEKFGRG